MMRFWTRCTITMVSVCLAVTALPGKDLVLCIGQYGHIALEFAQNGRCDEGLCRPIGETPRAPGMNRNDSACGDCLSCVDIPLSQGPVVGPTFVSDGTKNKPSCLSSPAMSAVLPASQAQNLAEAVRLASLSPPGNGTGPCASARILRI